jgi:hypothetical protein
MSQIPFVNHLGDAIDAAISTEAAQASLAGAQGRGFRRGRRLSWIGVRRRHQRAMILLAAVVIGGGAIAVAQSLESSTALVTGGIVCYGGTGTGGSSQMYANVEARGRSPAAACADVFRADGPAALARPGVKLKACASPHGYVAVFVSNRAADQCQAEQMSPLPARSYAAAQVSVDRVVRALTSLGASRRCIAPQVLVGDVKRVLDRSGWSNWQAELQAQGGGSGGCGLFLATGSSFSDPTASLDASRRVVWISAGPLPSLLALSGPLDWKLLKASGKRCYTPAAARALVRNALARSRVEVRFALTQEPKGGGWAYAQQAYDRGCTIIGSIAPARYGRIMDVWLNSKSGPPEAFGGGPSQAQFKPGAPS